MNHSYQCSIIHDKLGVINTAWDEERLLITGVNINDPFENAEQADESFMEMRFKDLYLYLKHYSSTKYNYFPIECLDFSWAGDFYRKVYRALHKHVPRGEVITYAELASLSGSPRACRAVGTAMHDNRYLIAIPCHRVVGKNYLGNFAAGIETKKILMILDTIDIKNFKEKTR